MCKECWKNDRGNLGHKPMQTLESGGGVPDMDESMQKQKDTAEEDGGPGLLGCSGEPKERQRRNEICATNVADKMGVGRPGGRDARDGGILMKGSRDHPQSIRAHQET